MSEASKRVLEWREQKRLEGFMPVTIWIPGKVKNQMVNDAFQRHQDLGELITEVYLAHPPTKSGRGAALMDRQLITRLVQDQVAQALARQHPAPAPPAPALAPVSAGLKRCPKGHQYPAGSKECPQCRTLRKRAQRKREKEKRQGEVPA